MNTKQIISLYLKALGNGDYLAVTELFANDAIVVSPLYGEVKARDFYRNLFSDTSKSKITPLGVFINSEDRFSGAAYFRYDWTLRDGSQTSFVCVDVFQLSSDCKVKRLTIIYDTSKTRPAFEQLS